MTSCPRLHMACIVQSGIAEQSTQNAGSNTTAPCIIAARTLALRGAQFAMQVRASGSRTAAGRSQLFRAIQTGRKGPKISQKGANIGRQICKQKGTMHVHPYTDGEAPPKYALPHSCMQGQHSTGYVMDVPCRRRIVNGTMEAGRKGGRQHQVNPPCTACLDVACAI